VKRTLLHIAALLAPLPLSAAALIPGEPVRVTRSEMLMFQGKNFVGAAKGQELTLLKHEAIQKRVYLSFLKDDDTLVAVTLPEDAVEPGAPNPARDLFRGAEAIREQRYDDARRLLLSANADKECAPLASTISLRLGGVLAAAAQARTGTPAGRQAFTTALQGMRDTAEQLNKAGYPSLALALDEGTDRLGGNSPASKLDRAEAARRAGISRRCLMRARQAAALKRFAAASGFITEGLQAEPGQPELKALQPRIQKDIDDADSLYKTANKMRRFEGGMIHALSAIDDGLKLCSDHGKLRELRKELGAAFEERTSPPVTAAFLTTAKVSTPQKELEEGRRLYTNRCTECHDLEMLDSRTRSSWDSIVTGMSRRANLSAEEKARIMDYITAAQSVVEAGGSR
ncbi:MAG: cytochrome c, partial [Chthoniobacteraceae bacterium]